MKIGILTSVDTRHRFVAQVLSERFDIVAVGYEETGYDPGSVRKEELTPAEARIVEAHFEERTRRELESFGHQAEFLPDSAKRCVRRLKPGTLNDADTVELLRRRGVETLVVYGTNLIRSPLLEEWPGRIVNLHLGLSPYYRGTATNFYPLLNEEPQYVGATIHVIDAGIDSGPILRHARPEILADDGPHTIGCKAILAGIEAMSSVLAELQRGPAVSVPQWKPPNAKLYLRKDYHPRQVVELYRKLEAGLIPNYVERARREPIPLRLVGPGGTEPVTREPAVERDGPHRRPPVRLQR